MTISVVVPAYNLEGFLERTLATVVAQTSAPDEVLVVDDGSTDRTVAIAESIAATSPFPMHVLGGEHQGPGATRNRGVRAAKGEWIAFLDGDDEWDPRKIERLRAAIAQNPQASIIAHDEFERDVDGRTIHKPLHERYDPAVPLVVQLYRANFLSTSCVAAKRSLIDEVGGFDETLPSAQDFDLWLKLARKGVLVFLPEPLETYVIRPNSITSRTFQRFVCMMKIAKRHAPYVAAAAGAWRAYTLRLRLVTAIHHSILTASLGQRQLRVFLAALARLPFDLGGALLLPVSRRDS